jgi:hypothetical protein
MSKCGHHGYTQQKYRSHQKSFSHGHGLRLRSLCEPNAARRNAGSLTFSSWAENLNGLI